MAPSRLPGHFVAWTSLFCGVTQEPRYGKQAFLASKTNRHARAASSYIHTFRHCCCLSRLMSSHCTAFLY